MKQRHMVASGEWEWERGRGKGREGGIKEGGRERKKGREGWREEVGGREWGRDVRETEGESEREGKI